VNEEEKRLALILAEVHQVLRIECKELVDLGVEDANDWPDDLHPADVIGKYLARGYRSLLP
jgi:hypothetical protein